MALVALSVLRGRAQAHADMDQTGAGANSFVPTATWNTWINASAQRLYDVLTTKFETYYLANAFGITTDGTNNTYALPVDFYKSMGVDLQLTGSLARWVALQPFNFAERNRYAGYGIQSVNGITNLQYAINGNRLWLMPLPSSGQVLQLWYVPQLAAMALDTDTFDGVNGWEEWLCLDVAIKAMRKEEADTSALERAAAAEMDRIERAASSRDAGLPPTVSDIYRDDWSWP